MIKQIIETQDSPAAIGPYSQAVWAGDLLYTSGQIPIVPESGDIVSDKIEDQTHQVFKNLKGLIEAAGLTLDHVIKVTVFIKNMNDFGTINDIYSQYFTAPYPARSCVEVARLPKDVQIELEVVAKR